MCGIAGIHSPGQPPARELLQAMIGRLRHRGPDGSGVMTDGPVGLAHARLSIVDPEGGAQPLHNEDGSISVVFNGEIFNHPELRRELQARGHRFATRSDTEVLVHLYEEHGDAFVERLNGQFAFALWDRPRQRLLLARDRTGIRPLFYSWQAGRLSFASEVKALFADHRLPRRLDRRALGELFTCWAPLAPRSLFEGVQSLAPGHLLVASGATLQARRYWDWRFPAAPVRTTTSEAEAAEALRERLEEAVRLQLRADVPVGAYLSGGLDSSIIATLVRRCSDAPLSTFSLTFDDPEFDESAHQRLLADHLGSEHHALRCRPADIAAAFPRAIRHIESPVLRTAPVPMMLLAAQVRQAGYKVVLTGEGADEVFGGYDLFKEARVRRFMARAPGSRWRPRLLERLYPWLAHSPTGRAALAGGFFAAGASGSNPRCFAHQPRWTSTRRSWQFFSQDLRHALADCDPPATVAASLPADFGRWEALAQDQYIEAHTLLSGYLLSAQGDRVAMAESIESRFPFLDHRLIEFAAGLPAQWKLRGLAEKHLLKQSVRGLLPEALRQRSKQPYRAPDSACFFTQGRPLDYVAELLSPGRLAEAGYFDATAVGKLVEKCRAGRASGFADNMAFVGVLSTMLLHEQMLGGAG
ncbi:asparagine synthase (glutamine-hydrolyzing) [Eleftheria terrae]|uniref:asparagine synthase (glutamine-hydrolyzing) n=1 Tax=Eleftheria terrae TaxID=1597781 RepID=UPI00263BB63D|nr:asparagine synthase (glutamine-hydrolyzing) [Eleftheria terrae]WKB54558.1 asparagine synthase (glutamine-hydrolyzing) [Eleftheria terrae]